MSTLEAYCVAQKESSRLRKLLQKETALVGLTPEQARLLYKLEGQTVKMGALPPLLSISFPRASVVVSQMVLGGFLEYEDSGGDRRMRLVKLTDKGRGVVGGLSHHDH